MKNNSSELLSFGCYDDNLTKAKYGENVTCANWLFAKSKKHYQSIIFDRYGIKIKIADIFGGF